MRGGLEREPTWWFASAWGACVSVRARHAATAILFLTFVVLAHGLDNKTTTTHNQPKPVRFRGGSQFCSVESRSQQPFVIRMSVRCTGCGAEMLKRKAHNPWSFNHLCVFSPVPHILIHCASVTLLSLESTRHCVEEPREMELDPWLLASTFSAC